MPRIWERPEFVADPVSALQVSLPRRRRVRSRQVLQPPSTPRRRSSSLWPAKADGERSSAASPPNRRGILRGKGSVYEEIDSRLADWILRQSLFFVGTAPAGNDGHVNVSPKGPIGTLRVLSPHSVAYLDIVGSGARQATHGADPR